MIVLTNKRTACHLVSENTSVKIEGEVAYTDELVISSFNGVATSKTDENIRGYFNYSEVSAEEVNYNYSGNSSIQSATEALVYAAIVELKEQEEDE